MGYTLGYHGCQSVVTLALGAMGAALGSHHCLKNGHNTGFPGGGNPIWGYGTALMDCGA